MLNMMDIDIGREWRRERLADAERRVSYGLPKERSRVIRGFVRVFSALFQYDGAKSLSEDTPIVEEASAVCRRGRKIAASRRRHLDIRTAQAKFEALVRDQVSLTSDPAVEAAGRALLASLGPAARQFAWELAEQAAVEVDAQLPYNEVEVTLREGEPVLKVRERTDAVPPPPPPPVGDYEARITLRLPTELKNTIEEAARKAGDSVNSYLVKDIARLTTSQGKTGKKMRGKLRT